MADTEKRITARNASGAARRGKSIEALLIAGSQLIVEKPGFTVKDVAALAGVTSTTAFNNFANKSTLVETVVENLYGNQLNETFGYTPEPGEKIRQALEAERRLRGAEVILDFLTLPVAANIYEALSRWHGGQGGKKSAGMIHPAIMDPFSTRFKDSLARQGLYPRDRERRARTATHLLVEGSLDELTQADRSDLLTQVGENVLFSVNPKGRARRVR